MEQLKKELILFVKALSSAKITNLSREKLIIELTTNGVALLFTVLISSWVHGLISAFFRRKTGADRIAEKVHFLEKFQNKSKIIVEEETISFMEEWGTGFIVFVIGLFIFTYLEKVMELYLASRRTKSSEVF